MARARGNPLKGVLDGGSSTRRSRGLFAFIGEVWTELSRVTWPSRETATRLTMLVLAVTVVAAIFLGIWDFGFTQIADRYIN